MSLEWFTSISGILITVGILLLVVALIILILGKKKGNGAATQAANAQAPVNPNMPGAMPQDVNGVNQMPMQPNNMTPPVIDVTSQPIAQQAVVEAPQPVMAPVGVSNQQVSAPIAQINTEAIAPTIDTPPTPVIAPPQEAPVDASVTHSEAAPLNVVNPNEAPVDASASAQMQTPVQPQAIVQPQAQVQMQVPVQGAPMVSSLGQTQIMPAVDPSQSMPYGGADPSANVQMQPQSQTTQIYGGADPSQGINQPQV